jgi:hypothetical protein
MLSIAALVVLGAADMVSVVVRQTLVQLQTPDNMRGRVTAVNTLFVGTSNQLGEFRAGTMAEFTGAMIAVVAGGVGTLLIVALWMKMFPALVKVDDLTRSEAAPEKPKRQRRKAAADARPEKPARGSAALERSADEDSAVS